MQTTRSLGFSERLDRLKIVVSYLKSLAAESAVRRPMYRMAVARTFVYLGPAASLGLMATGRYFLGFAILTLTLLALPLLLFYDVGQRGRLAHLVSAYARSDKGSLNADAADRSLEGKRGRLFLLGLSEWLERRLQNRADAGGEGGGIISSLLAGLFWGPIVLLGIALVALGMLEVAAVSTLLWIGAGCGLLLAVPMAGIQALRETVKAVYFTALYMLIAHPDELGDERAESLEGLVRFSQPDEGGSSAPGEEAPGHE